jgi:hypothetical protein
MKEVGYGDGYVYAHDTLDGLGDMGCLPDALAGTTYYAPGRRGFEAELSGRIERIRQWHERRRRRGGQADDKDGAGRDGDSEGRDNEGRHNEGHLGDGTGGDG